MVNEQVCAASDSEKDFGVTAFFTQTPVPRWFGRRGVIDKLPKWLLA